MEAKDTVNEEMVDAVCQAKGLWKGELFEGYAMDAPMEIAKLQSEISFKAGRKEVVDWVEENSDNAPAYSICEGSGLKIPEPLRKLINSQDWKAKLKEWGIE